MAKRKSPKLHPKCKPMPELEDGWSEWMHPLPGYLLQCCDCGLIHDMHFAIMPFDGEPTEFNEGESEESGLIVFRARRHEPCDRDGAEGGDANAAPVPQDRQARAEGIAQ